MARIRYLKPDFFKDEDLAEHPFWIRLLFAGLWNIADKKGRLEDRIKRIKIDVFPYDNVDIEKGLQELSKPKNGSRKPFILRYDINGDKFIQIVNWDKHQRPHHTEQESKIPPAPPTIMEKGMEKQDEGSKELRNGEGTVKTPLFSFDEVYLKYPNKVGRSAAFRHFGTSVKTEQDWLDIQAALKNYLLSERVRKGFIQNASTWFNGWRDWVKPADGKIKPPEPKPDPACEICQGKGKILEGSQKGAECICVKVR